MRLWARFPPKSHQHGHSTRSAASAGADWFAHSPARRRYLSKGWLPCCTRWRKPRNPRTPPLQAPKRRGDNSACLPFSRALACLVDREGYAPALTQAALLEAYGGHAVAVEAAALSETFRAGSVARPADDHAAPPPQGTCATRRGHAGA